MEADHPITEMLLDYAYEPALVYGAIVFLLVASSFGLPFPEEVTLLSAGLIAHIGSNPDLYPPPTPDAVGVSVGLTAAVCFGAVFLSDLLVFVLGRHIGTRVARVPMAQRFFKPELLVRINYFTKRYGTLACGVFRFTPGLRFPGHFACGSLGIPYSKFILVDGIAAMLTVPTQVLLMAYFGQEILGVLKNVKIALGVALLLALIIFLGRRWYRKRRQRASQPTASAVSGDARGQGMKVRGLR